MNSLKKAISSLGTEKISAYSQLINKFKNNQNDKILLAVAMAYFNLGNNLEGQDKIDTYHELIKQFKNSQNEEILPPVAKAYVNLSNELINTNQRSEAIQLLCEGINRFKDSDDQAIQLQLAKMQFLYNSLIQNS